MLWMLCTLESAADGAARANVVREEGKVEGERGGEEKAGRWRAEEGERWHKEGVEAAG